MAGAVRGSFWKRVLEEQWVRASWTEASALALRPKVAPGGSVLTSTSGGEARQRQGVGSWWGSAGVMGSPCFHGHAPPWIPRAWPCPPLIIGLKNKRKAPLAPPPQHGPPGLRSLETERARPGNSLIGKQFSGVTPLHSGSQEAEPSLDLALGSLLRAPPGWGEDVPVPLTHSRGVQAG